MIVDQFEEVLKKTSHLFPLPTATASASPTHVAPIPTVLPDTPTYETVGDSGSKTLWIVFVLMLIASAGFTALSWKIPVVRDASASLPSSSNIPSEQASVPCHHDHHHHHCFPLLLRHGHWTRCLA